MVTKLRNEAPASLRAIAAAAVLTALLTALFAPVADAKPRAGSTVVGEIRETGIRGEVRSVGPCVNNRRVTLVERDESGMRSEGPTVRTKKSGRYRFEPRLLNLSSTYWVSVAPRERKRFICGGDRSPNLYEPDGAR